MQAPSDGAQPGGRPAQRRMSFTGGGERLLNPDMQLPITERKPHSATSPERLGFLEFGQADQSAVEPACLRLASRRCGNLHMV